MTSASSERAAALRRGGGGANKTPRISILKQDLGTLPRPSGTSPPTPPPCPTLDLQHSAAWDTRRAVRGPLSSREPRGQCRNWQSQLDSSTWRAGVKTLEGLMAAEGLHLCIPPGGLASWPFCGWALIEHSGILSLHTLTNLFFRQLLTHFLNLNLPSGDETRKYACVNLT